MRPSRSRWRLRTVGLVAAAILAVAVLPLAYAASVRQTDPGPMPWSFGVMGDTQWTVGDDPAGANPNTVARSLIDQLDAEFIARGVKFVIQTGDLTDQGQPAMIAARAAAAQDLYDAGIGFFPMRGNHETTGKVTNPAGFQSAFPQTQGAGATYGATDFTSPVLAGAHPDDLKGLSYSFDYGVDGNDARFVIIDPFATLNMRLGTAGNQFGYPLSAQQAWIDARLDKATRSTEHAFVLSHQNLIAENHADTLFRGYPGDNLPMQNAYFSSLQANGVRYTVGAHDHLHQRSIVTSPDGASRLQELITSAASSKFYDPQPLSTANFQGQKVRETSVSQELYRIGFYIFTIDGDQVTVDYYADDKGGWSSDACWPEAQTPVDCVDGGAQGSHVTPDLNFVKRESWGYDTADGTEYLFGGGAPNGTGAANGTDYTAIHETFEGTQASVVAGTYPNTSVDANARPLVQVVDTGWTKAGSKGAEKGLASDAFRLWGMSPVGSPRNSDGGGMTATFTLTMSYDPGSTTSLGNGAFGLGTRTSAGTWVNAVDLNVGGTTTFVMGPWAPGYGLGSYGTDPSTKTVWAVVNHDGSFAAANDIEPVPGQVK